MMRYEAKAILVAIAEPEPQGGIHAVMQGDLPLGEITFDKIYTAEDGTIEAAAATRRTALPRRDAREMAFDAKSRWPPKRRARAEAEQQAARASHVAAGRRARSPAYTSGTASAPACSSTPGVIGVDVSTIAQNGAVIRLAFFDSVETLQSALSGQRLEAGAGRRDMGAAAIMMPSTATISLRRA